MKALSAIIATIMLLMISVALVGVFYAFSSGLTTSSTSSASEQASQITKQLTSCMKIDNINGNQVLLTNCGKGTIENKSLVVMMDDVNLGASTTTINEDSSGTINVSGLWQIASGKRTLKISNGAAVAQALVDVQPNKDGLVGSWNFDVDSGNVAADSSGNGNTGMLVNMNTTGNATSGWTAGKYGNALQFDGADDYVDVGDIADLEFSPGISFTVSTWFKATYTGSANRISVSKGYWADTSAYGIADDSGNLLMYLKDDTGYQSVPVGGTSGWNDNNYHHVVGTKFGTIGRLYVDGVLKGEETVRDSSYGVGAAKFLVGSVDGEVDRYFPGTIDEVRIWNRALTPDETINMKQII